MIGSQGELPQVEVLPFQAGTPLEAYRRFLERVEQVEGLHTTAKALRDKIASIEAEQEANMNQGTRIVHKMLGRGTVQPYINLDGTNIREEIYRASGVIFVKLDEPPEGWPAVVQVDVEACRQIAPVARI